MGSSADGTDGAIGDPYPAVAHDVAVYQDALYLGGAFESLVPDGAVARGVALWNGTEWDSASLLRSTGVDTGLVLALQAHDSELYAGGTFADGGYIGAADAIARWDGSSWRSVGPASPRSPNGDVHALASSGSDLYVGTQYGANWAGIPQADYVARWDGSSWHALGSSQDGTDGAVDDWVMAIATSGTDVYVGGSFENVAGIPQADYVARWDGSSWHALGSSPDGTDGALNWSVTSIAVDGTDVYLGGGFSNAGGVAQADFLARWDGTRWHSVGSDPSGNDGAFDFWIDTLEVIDSDLYAGGRFDDVAGIAEADRIARWDGSAWHALGANPAGTDGALSGEVNGIVQYGADIVVSGYFRDAAGIPQADFVAAYGPASPAPAVSLEPASVDFGDVYLGASTTPVEVRLTNTGSADLAIGTLALSGAGAGDFELVDDTCSLTTKSPSATCTVSVRFTPSDLGSRDASLNIPTNAHSTPDSVPFVGLGSIDPCQTQWANPESGDWHSPTNWTNGVPDATKTACIGTGSYTVTIRNDAAARALRNEAHLLLAPSPNTIQLDVADGPVVNSGSITTTVGVSVTIEAERLTNEGSIEADLPFQLYAPMLENSGSLVIRDGGLLDRTTSSYDGLDVTNTGTIHVDGAVLDVHLRGDNTFTHAAGDLILDGKMLLRGDSRRGQLRLEGGALATQTPLGLASATIWIDPSNAPHVGAIAIEMVGPSALAGGVPAGWDLDISVQGGDLALGDGSGFANAGTLTLVDGDTIGSLTADAGSGTFTNTGVLDGEGGIRAGAFRNSGIVASTSRFSITAPIVENSGDLAIHGGGALNASDLTGSHTGITNAGTISVGAGEGLTVYLYGGQTFRQIGGSLTVDGNLSIYGDDAGGTFSFEGGDITQSAPFYLKDSELSIGPSALSPPGGLAVQLVRLPRLANGVPAGFELDILADSNLIELGGGSGFTNAGDIVFTGVSTTGSLALDTLGGQLVNTGSLTFGGAFRGIYAPSIDNSGTFAVNDSGSLYGTRTAGDGVDMANADAVRVASGQTLNVNLDGGHSFEQTAGELVLDGTLAASTVTVAGGVVRGTGVLDGDLHNHGTVAPGASAGVLTVTGAYRQAADGRLLAEIGSTSVSDIDLLSVGGPAELGGLLVLDTTGYSPALGDTATVLEAASLSGTFSSISGDVVGASLQLVPDPTVSRYRLRVSGLTPTISLDVPDLSTSSTVPVTLSYNDTAGAGILGYIVSEDGTAPVDDVDPRWSSSEPTFIALAAAPDGSRTVHAWVIDGHGTISARTEDTTFLDVTAPTVTLGLPASTTSSEIAVNLTGNDGTGVGIADWYLSLADTFPPSDDPEWTTTKPTSFTLPDADGSYTLYAWARDAVGHVSTVASDMTERWTPAPGLAIDPTSLGFGSVVVGAASSGQTLTLTNDGSAALVLGSITIGGANAGEFTTDSDACSGQTLAPTSSCDMAVEFSPAVTGARSASLSIPSNAASSPDAVSLTGTGEAIATIKLIDDKSSGFAKFKPGWKKQGVGWNGRSFWTPVRKNSAYRKAIWQATLDAPGTYEVWVRCPKRNATTRSAKYKVFTTSGVVTRKKNQKFTAGKWTKLGTFTFGDVAKVKLTDQTGERTRSGRRVVFDVVKFVPTAPAVAAEPMVVEPTIVEAPAVRLRPYPKTVTAVTGARKVVSAWTCPADDKSPFGPDRTPGTRDDDCDPVTATWELKDPASANLSRRTGHAVRVQLTSETDNRLIATWDDQYQGVKLIAKPRSKGTKNPTAAWRG